MVIRRTRAARVEGRCHERGGGQENCEIIRDSRLRPERSMRSGPKRQLPHHCTGLVIRAVWVETFPTRGWSCEALANAYEWLRTLREIPDIMTITKACWTPPPPRDAHRDRIATLAVRRGDMPPATPGMGAPGNHPHQPPPLSLLFFKEGRQKGVFIIDGPGGRTVGGTVHGSALTDSSPGLMIEPGISPCIVAVTAH